VADDRKVGLGSDIAMCGGSAVKTVEEGEDVEVRLDWQRTNRLEGS